MGQQTPVWPNPAWGSRFDRGHFLYPFLRACEKITKIILTEEQRSITTVRFFKADNLAFTKLLLTP